MPKYVPTIGLEIHAELKTASKMFCDCKNDLEEKMPNQNVCPICLGHPGVLPTINRKAIEAILKTGLALRGEIAKVSKFDRKNYFYPDLPKGYQISQYDAPLVKGGELAGVKITRIHIEEDAGRLVEFIELDKEGVEKFEEISKDRWLLEKKPEAELRRTSLVDFNRAGVPLMELVTEPVIHDAQTAVRFAKELQLLLRTLGVADADMEKGQMRVEVNISVAKEGERGVKVEIKNLNSFKAVQGAIAYEIERQTGIVKDGDKVEQGTRGWDESKRETFAQRIKEEAQDYRYFPEPDLPPMDLGDFDLEALKNELPELPQARKHRLSEEYALTEDKAEMLIADPGLANYFEEAASELLALDDKSSFGGKETVSHEILYNYLTSDLRGILNAEMITLNELKFTPHAFAHLIYIVMTSRVSSRGAKDILKKMFETGLDPEEILNQENLGQISEKAELEAVVKKIMEENPSAVTDYKKGKENALQFLVGKAMAELRGRGNPGALIRIFKELLAEN